MRKIEVLISAEKSYAAPSVNVLNLQSESVLCSSTGGFTVNDWERDNSGSIDF